MLIRVDQAETSTERMPAAIAEAAGSPGWPGSKMRTDFCSAGAAETLGAHSPLL